MLDLRNLVRTVRGVTFASPVRTAVGILVGVLALVDTISIALLTFGVQQVVRLGVRRLHAYDITGAAEIGIVLYGAFLIIGWRSRIVRNIAVVGLVAMTVLSLPETVSHF